MKRPYVRPEVTKVRLTGQILAMSRDELILYWIFREQWHGRRFDREQAWVYAKAQEVLTILKGDGRSGSFHGPD
jgi:hypothetical protein